MVVQLRLFGLLDYTTLFNTDHGNATFDYFYATAILMNFHFNLAMSCAQSNGPASYKMLPLNQLKMKCAGTVCVRLME